ncbi:unnamed protein product [Haemonchus placei]|uniref:Uncharacterized protein n=1 Tax=Haemonchus placei TaxID=6290 RepID=A0A3P7W2R9_HAEPC|nr:unnamed protein product [Haemonchus placei]
MLDYNDRSNLPRNTLCSRREVGRKENIQSVGYRTSFSLLLYNANFSLKHLSLSSKKVRSPAYVGSYRFLLGN